MNSNRHGARLEADAAEAAVLRINATPTFIVGKSTAGGVEGKVIAGAQPYSAFEAELRRLAP